MRQDHANGARRVLITGANAGLGLATAAALATTGAHVLVHGRDAAKLEAAASAIRAATGAEIDVHVADFARLADVARLAGEITRRYGRLDVLVNNAGLIRDRRDATVDGFETVFQVNHLAPYLLTRRLLPALEAAPAGRIVNVASGAHGMVRDVELETLTAPERYDAMAVYARSKACNILFNCELARRLDGTRIRSYALHPGVVRTAFSRDGDVGGRLQLLFRMARPFMRTPERGADTAIWLASTTDPPPNGSYVVDRRVREPRAYARDQATAARLWELCERLVAAHLTGEDFDARAG